MTEDSINQRIRDRFVGVLAHWRFFNLSLAAKCRILFGLAVLLIIVVALAVPWYRMERLVEEQHAKEAEAIADAYLIFEVHRKYAGFDPTLLRYYFGKGENYPRPQLIKLAGKRSQQPKLDDKFIRKAIKLFRKDPNLNRVWKIEEDAEGKKIFKYLQAVRANAQCLDCHQRMVPGEEYRLGELVGVILLELPGDPTDRQLLWNRAAIIIAVILATLCAIAVFYFITNWLILAPISELQQVAERVGEGKLNTRVEIKTGDEFEDLANTFNQMFEQLEQSQKRLEVINKSLEARLGELTKVNIALDESNRLKSEFLANVSHELRTPLNSIIGFAELIKSHPEFKDNPKISRYANNILTSAKSLLSLINELLDLAKIEAGKMELHLEKVVISDLCENLYNLVKPLADDKHLSFELRIEEKLPIMETDPGKLQQILYNLLSNAIKFTPEGGRITLQAQSIPPEYVRISVSDTGPGIPEELHNKIFEKFYRGGDVTQEGYGGTGLGLAIAKELTVLLGGTISVASKIGEGTTFSIQLPIKIK